MEKNDCRVLEVLEVVGELVGRLLNNNTPLILVIHSDSQKIAFNPISAYF